MKWHDYLIDYSFKKDGYLDLGKGSIRLSRKNKINSFEEVDSVINFITEQVEGAKNLMINNIIYLGRHKHNDY